MPRFHFHVYDGSGPLDEEGSEFLDWPAAKIAAVRLAGEILKDSARSVMARDDWHLEVTDEAGLMLFRLDLCLVEAPVIVCCQPAPLAPRAGSS